MSWDAPLAIFDDEDEEALIRNFVELMAAHHPRYTEYQIAEQVFKGLRDPSLRSFEAARRWANDLDIVERIRKARNNGNKEFVPITKPEWQAKVIAIVEDDTLTPSEKKAKFDGLKLFAESESWIVKAIDKKVEESFQLPVVVYGPLIDE